MTEYEHVVQPFAPVYDEHSRILILGSLPSVKSREQGFYYGHPQNRFWKVTAAVLGVEPPVTITEKKTMLLQHGIAIWDVIESCDIIGSSDSSVKNAVAADVAGLVGKTGITKIFVNGTLAGKLYDRYLENAVGITVVRLPSTSPANARFSLEKLIESWQPIGQINQ